MEIHEAWQKALAETAIIRARIQSLQTFDDTRVPYILLSSSQINPGDTVVRTGEILVKRPTLILPPNIPQFEGFSFEEAGINENSLVNFLLVRGLQMPSMQYDNRTHRLDIYEGGLDKAVTHYHEKLQSMENVNTGLLVGPEDVWPFSLLIFICAQVARNAPHDIKEIIKRWRSLHEKDE